MSLILLFKNIFSAKTWQKHILNPGHTSMTKSVWNYVCKFDVVIVAKSNFFPVTSKSSQLKLFNVKP